MKRALMTYNRRLRIIGFLFVLPAVLYFALIYYFPLLRSFDLSFREVLPDGARPYVGLDTYRDVLADPLFWTSARNTVLFTFLSVLLIVVLGLVIAVALYTLGSEPMRNFYTVFYVLPTLVSFAAAGSIWEWIYHSQFGLANTVLMAIGLPRMKFLNDAAQVIPSLAIIQFWVRVGFAVLIIMAGLQSISSSFFDAAKVDGASGFRLHWHITLPMVLPQVAVVSLLEVIMGFRVFDVIYITTQGGPATSSYMLLLFFYDNAFRFYRQDRASVIAVMMFLVLLAFSIIQRRVMGGKRREI